MRFARLAIVFFVMIRPAHAQDGIRFGVLGLFHPRALELEPAGTRAIAVKAGAVSVILNGEPRHRRLLLRAENDRVLARGISGPAWNASARDGSMVRFRLTVPGRFHRIYEGRLILTAHHGELTAVVIMNPEVAVASIVGAEMGSNAPMEALKAQAVVTRSFLAAGSRHSDFDFCDTTHCQYLRSPDDAGPRVLAAVRATRGMVIAWQRKPLAALYSSRCGGHTLTLGDAGMNPGDGYPYYAVPCPWCREHPLERRDQHGSNFALSHGNGGIAEGNSIGHGVGLCQMGAIAMAGAGQDFRSIIAHFYPNTELMQLP